MSYSLLFLTQLILVYTGFAIWRTYKWKAFCHPGMFFCALWLAASSSSFILSWFPSANLVVNGALIDELHTFVLFTAFSFLLLKGWGARTVRCGGPAWRVERYEKTYRLFAAIALVLAIVDFVQRGAHLNAQEAHVAMVARNLSRFYGVTSQTFLQTLTGGAVSINAILCVVAGFIWARGERKDSRVWLAVPLLVGILNSLAVGGRMAFFQVLLLYAFGFALAASCGIPRERLKRVVFAGILAFCLFAAYSGWVYRQRTEGCVAGHSWNPYPALAPAASMMDCLGSSYIGYQYRRGDFVTPEPDWGIKSFGGVWFATLPFGAYWCPGGSVGDLLELEQYTWNKRVGELKAEHAPCFASISPMYLLLYDDFGYGGTLLVCFLLVALTQWIYVRWFAKPHVLIAAIYFPLMAFCFWSHSLTDPYTATAGWKVVLIAILMIELVQQLRKNPEAAADGAVPKT